MKERCKELPEELWESILNRLTLDNNYGDLQSPLLVCKQFLSITNRFHRKIVVAGSDNSNHCVDLSRAIKRFKNLKEMELVGYFPESDVDFLALKIAFSGLDLQSLCFRFFPISPSEDTIKRLGSTKKNLKFLRCIRFDTHRDPDLVHIADALPRLEELDIRYPLKFFPSRSRYPEFSDSMVTDAGIVAISRKLRGLRKIDIRGNRRCSDLSLIALSSNCMLLNEIECSSCDITRRGIDWALFHSTNSTSLKAGSYRSKRNSTFNFDESELDIWGDDDQEQRLCSIAKAGIPLEKLKLVCLPGFDIAGIMTTLHACPALKHFEVECACWFSDYAMRVLCECLPNIICRV